VVDHHAGGVRPDVHDRLDLLVQVGGGAQERERGQVDPGHAQAGLLNRAYSGQHSILRRSDQQAPDGLAVAGLLQRVEVQQRAVHRQRQHVAHLEWQ